MAGGRPTDYSDELADRVCEAIATTPRGLEYICARDDMPAASTVYKWLVRYPEFVEKYERAREAQSHLVVDQILDIADDGTNDFIDTEKGPILDREHVQRSKLRVDARFKYAAMLNPKKYGDKSEVDHKSSDGSMTPKAPVYKIVEE